jgi:HEPN domain-containing protein
MGEDYLTWLKRAESALALGLVAKTDEVFFEDLCFQLQQAVEKAMKALLIYNDTEPPITHSFAVLIRELRRTLEVPESIERAVELEDYAVQTRYPGDYTPVDETEYGEAKQIAMMVMKWIRSKTR